MKQKTILVITDGIGCNQSAEFNAFAAAKKPTYDMLFKSVPNTLLRTSGLAVGLPEGQMGNSEVGHMTIGSGRVLYQNLVKIDKMIENDTLKTAPEIVNLLKICPRVHVIGLYSDGGVHSHLRHFDALCQIAKDAGAQVFAHAITDGRDVSPTSGAGFLEALEAKFSVGSVCGRFYAMDRDNRWERVQKAYAALMGEGEKQKISPSEYARKSYEKGITDEFIEPAIFGEFDGIKENDGIIFVNFRNDRAREICQALSMEDFAGFERKFCVRNLITMTEYDAKFPFPIIVKKDILQNTLAEVIADAGLRQLHTAETEKYAHVTFFFNGGSEECVQNETRILIDSPKVATYDLCPAMSAHAVCEAVIKGIEGGEDFIVVNFANGDMVGHTGNFDAAVKAVEAVDECLGKIYAKAKEFDYAYVQISDHGNCEQMRGAQGELLTNHTTFDVFCFVSAQGVSELKRDFGLSNVAPTILKLMGLEIPAQMDEALF